MEEEKITSVADLLKTQMKDWVVAIGNCEKHGESEVTLHPRFASAGWYCSDCRQEKQREEDEKRFWAERRERLHKIASLPEKYRGKRFNATTAAQKQVRAQAKAFMDSLQKERDWAVLVLFGGVGTGKTLLATELSESLIDKMNLVVRYCTCKQMIAEIQQAYGTEGKSEEGEVLRFVNYDILILDEIDAKRDTENANSLLTEVINRRYNDLRPVIVITNQPFDGLAKFVGDRVDSRLHENAFVCSFTWDDFRKK